MQPLKRVKGSLISDQIASIDSLIHSLYTAKRQVSITKLGMSAHTAVLTQINQIVFLAPAPCSLRDIVINSGATTAKNAKIRMTFTDGQVLQHIDLPIQEGFVSIDSTYQLRKATMLSMQILPGCENTDALLDQIVIGFNIVDDRAHVLDQMQSVTTIIPNV